VVVADLTALMAANLLVVMAAEIDIITLLWLQQIYPF